jgi:hypothetical protein
MVGIPRQWLSGCERGEVERALESDLLLDR